MTPCGQFLANLAHQAHLRRLRPARTCRPETPRCPSRCVPFRRAGEQERAVALDDGGGDDDGGSIGHARPVRDSVVPSPDRRTDIAASAASGTAARGLRAVQTVAPKSIRAWLKSKTCLWGTSASETVQRWRIVAWLFGSPPATNTRNSTRATLVSRMAARSSERKAADGSHGVLADALEREQRVLVRSAACRRSARPTRARSPAGAAGGCCSQAAATSSTTSSSAASASASSDGYFDEPLVILRQHAIHLRLLQHHLRHQDVIRVGRSPARAAIGR